MLEKYIDRDSSLIISEIGDESAEGKNGIDKVIISRKTWLANLVRDAVISNPTLKLDIKSNFPDVEKPEVEKFLLGLESKNINIGGHISDFSVTENRLDSLQKSWYQQKINSTVFGIPLARLIPNIEEVVENFEETKKKGRLILSPAGLMVYEFTSYTRDMTLSGIILQTSFISIHQMTRRNGVLYLSKSIRGETKRVYDDDSIVTLKDHKSIMRERRKIASRSTQGL